MDTVTRRCVSFSKGDRLMMNRRLAYGFLPWTAVLAVCIAAGAPTQTRKSQTNTQSTKPATGEVVAVVNGEKILWSSIVDDLLDDQIARLSATQEQFKDNQRLVAGSAGALLLKKMSASGGTTATV